MFCFHYCAHCFCCCLNILLGLTYFLFCFLLPRANPTTIPLHLRLQQFLNQLIETDRVLQTIFTLVQPPPPGTIISQQPTPTPQPIPHTQNQNQNQNQNTTSHSAGTNFATDGTNFSVSFFFFGLCFLYL
jgi:hypothetical protein